MLTMVWMSVAWPCAGLVHEEGLSAESDGAEVLFEPGDGAVTVSYAVSWQGDAADFGWVIPVPDVPTSVADGDLERFDTLRALSAPKVLYPPEDEKGAGCGSCITQRYSLAGQADRANVAVVSEGFTGTYEYVVIAGTDAVDLEAWFADHGWEGLAADDLAHYVDQGWSFVALRVAPDTVGDPVAERLLPPIALTCPGDRIVFPAVMARHALAEAQRTTVYVVADGGADTSGDWTSVEAGPLVGGMDEDPNVLWEARLAEVGGDRGYVETWAGSTDDGRFLTRFDTLAPREVHDVDVDFVVEGDTLSLSTTIELRDGGSSGAVLWLPLVALGALRRRKGLR